MQFGQLIEITRNCLASNMCRLKRVDGLYWLYWKSAQPRLSDWSSSILLIAILQKFCIMNYMIDNTLEWFKSKIGKRIYRDVSTCTCHTCRDVEKNGIIVLDEEHAQYLADISGDFAYEGHPLNYRDTL